MSVHIYSQAITIAAISDLFEVSGMAVCVPYPGTSTQRRSAQTLTDRQAGLVARLAEDCRAFDAAGEVEQAPERRGGGGREFIAGRANTAVEAELAEEAAALLRAAGGEVQQFRRRLPSHGVKEELLAAVRGHQVVVVSGETGCGKTTQVRHRSPPHPPPALQVPQFILDDAVARGEGSKVSVVCTQVPALHLPPRFDILATLQPAFAGTRQVDRHIFLGKT